MCLVPQLCIPRHSPRHAKCVPCLPKWDWIAVSSGCGSSACDRKSYPGELIPKSGDQALVICKAQVGWHDIQMGSCLSAAGAHACTHMYLYTHKHCQAQDHQRCLWISIIWDQGFSAAWDVSDSGRKPWAPFLWQVMVHLSDCSPVEGPVPSEQVFKYWECLINGP